jgi:hypothetical protein
MHHFAKQFSVVTFGRLCRITCAILMTSLLIGRAGLGTPPEDSRTRLPFRPSLIIETLPKQPGELFKARVEFAFDSIPRTTLDSSWQACLYLFEPNHRTQTFKSDLRQIVPGKTESFEVEYVVSVEGKYVVSAVVYASTFPKDAFKSEERGEIFECYSAEAETLIIVGTEPPPDTGWHDMGNGAMIKITDNPPPLRAGVFRELDESVSDRDSNFVRLRHDPLTPQPPSDAHKISFKLPDQESGGPQDTLILGSIQVDPNSHYVIKILNLKKAFGLRLSDKSVGALRWLDDGRILLKTHQTVRNSRLYFFANSKRNCIELRAGQ